VAILLHTFSRWSRALSLLRDVPLKLHDSKHNTISLTPFATSVDWLEDRVLIPDLDKTASRLSLALKNGQL
jgi:hypothetical protein